MKTSPELNEISLALSSYQAEAVNPFKDKAGKSYTYADLSSVLDVCRSAVASHGLSFTQMPYTGEGTIGVETLLMHKSGQWIASRVEVPLEIALTKDGRPIMSPAQAAGSVITYLRRYALTAVLGLAQDDDDAASQANKADTAESWINYNKGKKQPAPQASNSDIQPTQEQWVRLEAVTPKDKIEAAQEWFMNQTNYEAVERVIKKKEEQAA